MTNNAPHHRKHHRGSSKMMRRSSRHRFFSHSPHHRVSPKCRPQQEEGEDLPIYICAWDSLKSDGRTRNKLSLWIRAMEYVYRRKFQRSFSWHLSFLEIVRKYFIMRYTSLRVHSKQKFQKYDDFTFCTEDTRCSECGWKLCDIRSLVVRIPQQGCPSPTIEGTCDQVSFKSKKKRIRGFLYPPPLFF